MLFRDRMIWLQLLTAGNLGKIISAAVLLVVLFSALAFKSWHKAASCDIPLQQAETALLEALYRVDTMETPGTGPEFTCPAYKDFLQIAGRLYPMLKKCNFAMSTPVRTSETLNAHIATISKRTAEICDDVVAKGK